MTTDGLFWIRLPLADGAAVGALGAFKGLLLWGGASVYKAPLAQLDPARFGVMLNMAFQMGVDGLLGFKNTLAMVKAGDYEGAATGMLHSKWATQTPARAQRLSKQMKSGVWQ